MTDSNTPAEDEFVDTVYGALATPPNSEDLIRRFLTAYGEWGYCEPLLLGPLLGEDATVFDIGAFVGTFGLGIAQQGARRIIAVEANEIALPFLQRNLASLCKAEHHTVHAAVRAEIGLAQRDTTDESNLGATTWRDVRPGEAATAISVQGTTLSALRERFGDYHLLKLDIEGAERDALLGDIAWIQEAQPIVWAECNESAASLSVVELLLSAGLSLLYVAYPCFRQNSFRTPGEHIFPLAYEAALLAGSARALEQFNQRVVDEELIVAPVRSVEEARQLLWRTPRWALGQWPSLTRIEILGLLGRYHSGERFETFLQSIT